jgi:hypothetical protein
MSLHATSHVSSLADSRAAAAAVSEQLQMSFAGQPLRALMVYSTVNHDQAVVLRVLRDCCGADVLILGCSAQGIMHNGAVGEGSFLLGVMGFGGDDLEAAAAMVRGIDQDSAQKGATLAAALKLSVEPKVVFLLYDPLCGADVEAMLGGFSEIQCPIVGGGAAQPWGPIVRTFQYWQGEVLQHGAVALALGGPFSAEVGVCHGTAPTGVEMTLTRCSGNKIFEIDGRPAIDIWREITGCEESEINNQDYVASWAIGVARRVPSAHGERTQYVIRAAFGFDLAAGAVIVQAAIPEGTRIMFHHRTVPVVTEGTASMGRELAQLLVGRRPWAVMGFECGARTKAFLGHAATLHENVALQKAVAPDAPWLGMLAWGEIAPTGGRPAFHNYTYPVAVLTEP